MKPINISSIVVENYYGNYDNLPNCYASYAEWNDGTELTKFELDRLNCCHHDLVQEAAMRN